MERWPISCFDVPMAGMRNGLKLKSYMAYADFAALLSVRMWEAWRVKMKFVLVTVALFFSTSAFAAVDASPPTELPGCELVGTVKNVKIWAGECEPTVRNGVPVGSNVVPVRPPSTQPGGSSKK